MNEALNTLGYRELKDSQKKVTNLVLSGADVFAVMPTGYGKSICYQLPALLMSGWTLVISPLIALMQDQVIALANKGVPARLLSSEDSPHSHATSLNSVASGSAKLLYISPERLGSSSFAQWFESQLLAARVSQIVFDESHCISTWGSDFRPGYEEAARYISQVSANLSSAGVRLPVITAFTATATESVQHDIQRLLFASRPAPTTVRLPPRRNNISYLSANTRSVKERIDRICESLSTFNDGVAIVYCSTRAMVDKVSLLLCMRGIQASAYHAGLPRLERDNVVDQFTTGNLRVVVATNAFGMGIDKSDVRLVVHLAIPQSLDDYYQEAGRAGRDGKPATALLLCELNADLNMRRGMMDNTLPEGTIIQQAYYSLHTLWKAGGRIPLAAEDKSHLCFIVGHGLTKSNFNGVMRELQRQSAVLLSHDGSHIEVFPDAQLNVQDIDRRREAASKRLQRMADFVDYTHCKAAFIDAYFGYESAKCGICVNCRGESFAKPTPLPRLDIIRQIRRDRASTLRLPPALVMPEALLQAILKANPSTTEDLKRIAIESSTMSEVVRSEILIGWGKSVLNLGQ